MYKALYTKWRPKTFDDVISQTHITVTLCNQIKQGRTAHAYLFTGSRGTGKTTCARIFAKAINCKNQQNGNPCCECEVCCDADDAALADIIEIDAASNNGVDDIRELREGALFTPERCQYKVYIIDEVHMLSTSAFNALLKLLEEPPVHVKFILATTEVHKIPATILSRCQRFDFRRISSADIAKRLLYIADNEDFSLDDEAALRIARLADGGMRDALSLLDQCAAFSSEITSDIVSEASGVAGREYLFDIMSAVCDKNATKSLEIIEKLYSLSKDMQRLCSELIMQFRNLMLLKASSGNESLLDCMPSEIDRLKAAAEALTLDDILSVLSALGECSEKLVRAVNKRVEFEMCLISLCTARKTENENHTATDKKIVVALEERIAYLENRLKTTSIAGRSSQRKEPESPPAPMSEQQGEVQVDLSSIKPNDFKRVEKWNEVIEEFFEISPATAGSLDGSVAYEYENIMLIVAKNPFFIRLFKDPANKNALSEAVRSVLGKQYVIRAKIKQTENESTSNAENFIRNAESAGVPTEILPDGR